MEEFKCIGYKNSFSTWVLLIGSLISFILMTLVLFSKIDHDIIAAVIFLLLTIIFFASYIIEKKRPYGVVFLSNNSLKIWKGSKWKVISFDVIDSVDYKLGVYKKVDSLMFGAGWLIIESNTKKFVFRNIEGVRDCYEKIVDALKEYKNSEEKE